MFEHQKEGDHIKKKHWCTFCVGETYGSCKKVIEDLKMNCRHCTLGWYDFCERFCGECGTAKLLKYWNDLYERLRRTKHGRKTRV